MKKSTIKIINIIQIKRLFSLFSLILFSTMASGGCARSVPYIPPAELPTRLKEMGYAPTQELIAVDSKTQTLTLLKDGKIKKTFSISTGKNGLGQRINSLKTPQGLHRVNEKIGHGVPKYGIFYKRNYVGETWKKIPPAQHRKDFISTRILRLEGLQKGFNKGRDWIGRKVDTEERAVYIHGTTMEWKLGFPSTKGCVHMSADDVIKLFNEVQPGTLVWIN